MDARRGETCESQGSMHDSATGQYGRGRTGFDDG